MTSLDDFSTRTFAGPSLANESDLPFAEFGLKPLRRKPSAQTSEVKKSKPKPTEESSKPT